MSKFKKPRQRMKKAQIALRGVATESVLELVREKPFAWDGANCVTLARLQAVAMGHDVPALPKFRTAKGALRALKKHGVSSTAELLDLYFERHPAPAFARIGDLVLLPGENEAGERDDTLGAIGIADGRGNIFAWHGSDMSRLSVIKWAAGGVVAAWRL